MFAHIDKVTKNKFLRNIVIVATGTAGAQIIAMLFSPVVTRLYGPEAFGLLGVFVAIVAVLGPIAALTYPTAIVLPKSDIDAQGLATLSLLLAIMNAFLVILIIWIIGDWVIALLNLESISQYVLLVPVAMLFTSLYQIIQQWLIRKNQFNIIARVAILQAFIINMLKIGIGWFNPIAGVLIVLTAISNAFYVFLLWLSMGRTLPIYFGVKKKAFDNNQEKKSLISLAKAHRDFPTFQMPQVLLNTVAESIPVLMLASFYGAATAGFYTLARTVIMLPTALIAKSVGDVVFPKLNERHNQGLSGKSLLVKSTLGLAIIGIFPLITLFIFGEFLFILVFGSEWGMSGIFASWLCIWIYFSFINPPSVKAVIIYKKQKFALVLNVFTLTLRVFGLYCGYYYFNDAVASLIMFALAGALHNIIFISAALFFSGRVNNES